MFKTGDVLETSFPNLRFGKSNLGTGKHKSESWKNFQEYSTVNYEDLKANLDDVILVDVRGKEEIAKDGRIEGSRAIPVDEVESAMELSDDDFKEKYGFDKPSENAQIVTHCRSGNRAQMAAQALWHKGFKNVRCYQGSLNDWKAKGGDVITCDGTKDE